MHRLPLRPLSTGLDGAELSWKLSNLPELIWEANGEEENYLNPGTYNI